MTPSNIRLTKTYYRKTNDVDASLFTKLLQDIPAIKAMYRLDGSSTLSDFMIMLFLIENSHIYTN